MTMTNIYKGFIFALLLIAGLVPVQVSGQIGLYDLEPADSLSTGDVKTDYSGYFVVTKLDTIGADDYLLYYEDTLLTVNYGSDSIVTFGIGDTIFITYPEGGGGSPGDSTYYWGLQSDGGAIDTITIGEIVNLVSGTGISINQGATNVTITSTVVDTETDIDSVALIGSTLHIYEDDKDRSVDLSGLQTAQDTQSLLVLNDSTIGLTWPNSSEIKDTVYFDFAIPDELKACRATYVGDTLTVFICDTANVEVDSFKVEVIGGRDTYVDSAYVNTVGQIDSIWFYRDSLGINADSFLVVLNDSIVPDTQSLDLIGNTLSISRGNSVDLSQYLDDTDTTIPDTYVDTGYVSSSSDGLTDTLWYVRDSSGISVDSFFLVVNDNVDGNGIGFDSYVDSGFHLIDTLTLYRYKDGIVIDSFKTEVDDDDWYRFTNRPPDAIDQDMYTGTSPSKNVVIGQDSLATGYGGVVPNLMINSGIYPFGTYSRSIPTTLWRQTNSDGEYFDRVQQPGQAYIRLGDHDTGNSGVYILMYNGYTGDNALMFLDSTLVSFRTDDAQLYGYPNTRDDGEPIDSLLNIYYAGSEGEIHQIPWSEVAASLHDFDFIQVPDTSIVGLAGRIPLDSTDLDTIIWRSGSVIIGDSVNRDTSYKGGYVLIDSADPLLNLNGQRNALDMFDQNAVEMYLRNRQADFVLRNHNDDPLIFNDTLETHFELAVNSYLNPIDTVSFREPLRISSRATDRALNIGQEYIRLADYGTGQDTLVKDSVLAVLVPDATGKLHRVSRDTLNAALNVAASAPQEIDTFSIVNDSLLLDLTNTVGSIQRVDLSKYVNDTTYITGDSLIVGDSIYNLPQGADSLGTAFTNYYPIVGDGTRGGKTISNNYFTNDDIYNLPGAIITGTGTGLAAARLELGGNRFGSGNAFIDFHNSVGSDYGARIIKQSSGNFVFENTGGHDLLFFQGGLGNISFATNSSTGITIKSDQQVRFNQYGSGTFNTAAPAYWLGVDASGNILERTDANLLSDIGAQSGTEIYGSSFGWNTGTGVLTLNRSGASAITVDLDGRYDNYNSWDLYTSGTFRGGISASEDVDFVAGTPNLNISYTSGDGQNNIVFNVTETDGSTTNELQSLSNGTRSGSAYGINISGGTGTSLFTFNSTQAGLVPSSGGGTTNFLRADGSWAAPPSGGADDLGSTHTATNIIYSAGSDDAASDNDFYYVSGTAIMQNHTTQIDGDANVITFTGNGTILSTGQVNIESVTFSGTDINDDVDIGTNLNDQLSISTSGTYARVGNEAQTGSFVEFQDDGDIVISASGSGDNISITANSDLLINGGALGAVRTTICPMGIKRDPTSNDLEVQGTASKGTAGDWLANSDRRLKKNITQLSGKDALDKLLILKGVNYEWNDKSKTLGYDRPEGKQWGLIAQDIRKAFGNDQHFTQKDGDYFNAAYGTYDPLFIESFRYLKTENDQLKDTVAAQKNQIDQLQRMFFNLQQQVKELQDANK